MSNTHALPPLPLDSDNWRDEIVATFRLAWPLALANLLQMLVHAVDVIFVARLGERELAASALGIALFGLLMWAFSGLTGMVAALIAEELGRRRHAVREVRRSVRMGLWLAVLTGLAGMAICWSGEYLLLASGQDRGIAARAGDFLRIIMWAMIPMILANVLRSFVAALGRPVFATAITGLAIFVSVAGNYAFVFGNLGAPALGLEGSALASVLTSLFILSSYVVAILWDRRLRRYRIFGNWWRSEWQRFRELVRLGTPVMLTIIAEAGLFSGAALLMGRIGASELAGHTVALQIAALAFQIPFGIGQAATIRVGYHYGARDHAAVGRAGWVGIGMGAGFMCMTALAMVAFPTLILRIYIDPTAPANAAMVGFALQYIVIAAAFQLFDGVQAVAAGALRGVQDTRIPMVIAIFSYWVPGLGAAIWLGFHTSLEGTGVWVGLAIGLVFAAALLLWRWARREKLGLVRSQSQADSTAEFFAARPVDSVLACPHLRPAGTLDVGVPIHITTQAEKVILMAFRPLHDRVLVRRIEAEEKTAGGIIIPDSAKEKPSEGEVIATGSGARAENGTITPMDVKAGDRVLFGKWSGTEVKIDGEDLLIMKESDIMGVIG